MKRANPNEAITPHFDISILVPCERGWESDGTVYDPGRRPVAVARVDAEDLKDEWLLKKFDPQGTLITDFALADALERGDEERARKFISGSVGQPEDVLARRITDALKETRFVIWRDESAGNKLRPGILCENARQAAYALLVEHLGRPGNWSRCQKCQKFFQKRRAWQPYCSSRCRINAAMKRYRERKAELQRRKRRAKR